MLLRRKMRASELQAKLPHRECDSTIPGDGEKMRTFSYVCAGCVQLPGAHAPLSGI
jgi:hypothetical protein